ncbi:stage II sporulation protein M [Alienimonas sp. DA493]|uniref:stage II sporulation protein M n=1 Tax=Alienimonas sp. DA493 TaxID=3373605 RepID=UPI0037548E2A
MTKRDFLAARRPRWDRFTQLLDRFDRRRLRGRTAGEVAELSRGLRELAADLAAVRAHGWGDRLDDYLNTLLGRGHTAFYAAPASPLGSVVGYLTHGFPRVFRRNGRFFLVAAALFFGPFFVAWAAVALRPALADRVLPPEAQAMYDEMYAEGGGLDPDGGEDGRANAFDLGAYGGQRSLMAGFYVYNNVGIALKCFALGVTFGLGTVYVLLSNGIQIGAVFGYAGASGNGERLFSFAVTHGSFELTAIAVAGGAGLMLADALLHPGRRSRLGSLMVRGREAIQIAAGAAVMLMIAAGLEAFWSPAPIAPSIKYVVGGSLWVAVFAWLLLAGRGGAPTEANR